MSRYGSVAIATPSSIISRVVQSAEPDDLAAKTNAAIAALPAGYTVVGITLAGAGDGSTFTVTVEAGANANVSGGFSAPPSVTCFLASDAEALLIARLQASPSSGVFADTQVAGASKGTRFMGLVVKGTVASGGSSLPECVFGHIPGGTGIPATPGLVGSQATFPDWTPGDAVVIACALTVGAPLFFVPPVVVGLVPVVSFDGGATWEAASDGNVQSAQIVSNDQGNLVVSVIVPVECPSAPRIGMFAYAPSDCQVIGGATIVATRVRPAAPTGNSLVPYP
jgi:hypothetical protein